REKVFAAFAPQDRMQLYNRGIRRRLTPMLGNNRQRLELAFSLLFSLPGTPMMQYGDEIGIGDNLRLPERECARTPMQWTAERHGGFSRARRVVRPVIDDDVYGYERVNVADQRRDPESLVNVTERLIRMRKECPELGWGKSEVLATSSDNVLALASTWRGNTVVCVHNFAGEARDVILSFPAGRERQLTNLLSRDHSLPDARGRHCISIQPYGYRWYRVGAQLEAATREPR